MDVDRLKMCERRVRKLEERDVRRAQQLMRSFGRNRDAYRALEVERSLRKEAELNANRFHALLIAERIRKIEARS